MPIPSHKRNFPVTLDRAMLSRLDRIAKGCRLHRSSVLSGLIAEGLESLEARYEHAPDDLRLELGEAVHALRREIARQRMWELFQDVRCSTNEARERSVVDARRQAEREVGLPTGTLGRTKPHTRQRRDQVAREAHQESFARQRPPAATDSASNAPRTLCAEGQGGGESDDIDQYGLLLADPSPSRGGPSWTDGGSPQSEGESSKSEVRATRKRAPRKRRRGPRRTALPRARRAYELRMMMGMGWDEIAHEVGYSSKHGGQSAKEMAKRYALRHGYQWPVR